MIVKFNINPLSLSEVIGGGPTDDELFKFRDRVDNYMKCLNHNEYLGSSGFTTTWRLTTNDEFTLGSYLESFKVLNEHTPDNIVVSTEFYPD